MVILFKCRNHFRRVIELHISHSSCLKSIAIWLLQNYEWFEKEALLSSAINICHHHVHHVPCDVETTWSGPKN